MQSRTPKILSWPEIVAALRVCTGESVLIRDGRVTQPAGVVRTRPSAKGTELCLFPGERSTTRIELMERLATLAKMSRRSFAGSARAKINESYLLIDAVADEDVDGVLFVVVRTRRPTLGFNRSQQTGERTTLRTKRIKMG